MRILTAAGAAIFVAFVAGLLSENWDLVVGAVVATVLWIIVMDRSAKRSGWSKGERP
jgi:Flp pilus assembly protein TadB